MRPIEWFNALLLRHKLDRPDGRPLYQYRLTDLELDELIALLKLSSEFGVGYSRKMLFWDASFVIYAAEWWRRFYEGKWGWDGIFESINIPLSDLDVLHRNELVESGLQAWKRKVRHRNGKRYFLGTIATEGGLPLHQLSESGGWLRNILEPVITKHVSSGLSITSLIESYNEVIPKNYRSDEMKQILEEIAEITVGLRKEYELNDKDDPLQWLDKNGIKWRERYPLPINDAAARSLLGELVGAVARARTVRSETLIFELERGLIRSESPSPCLTAQVNLPRFLIIELLTKKMSHDQWPPQIDIDLVSPAGGEWKLCRGLRTQWQGRDAYRLTGFKLLLRDDDALKPLHLRFKSFGAVLAEMELDDGERLDTSLPWLFKDVDSRWLLQGQASQSVKAASAIAYIPASCDVVPNVADLPFESLAPIYDGRLVKFAGRITCTDDDAHYRLSSGREQDTEPYRLGGIRCDYAQTPSETFVGLPYLLKFDLGTGHASRQFGATLLARPLGESQAWKPLREGMTGCFEIRLLGPSQEVLLRKRIGILPGDFSLTLKADHHQARSGKLLFSGIQNWQASQAQENIECSVTREGDCILMQLATTGLPPSNVLLALQPKDRARELILNVPFPSKGALLFDQNNRQLKAGAPLYLSNIRGHRIKLFDSSYHQGRQCSLVLTLSDPGANSEDIRDIYISRYLHLSGTLSEFSIADWEEIILELIGVSASLDACVNLFLELDGQPELSIKLKRYECELKPNWQAATLELMAQQIGANSPELLEQTELLALELNRPKEDPVKLLQLRSEGVPMGVWQFEPESKREGPWLIYPAETSPLQFRSMLWIVGEKRSCQEELELEKITLLSAAAVVADEALRHQAMRLVFEQMSSDFSHESWNYLDHLWQKTHHLPLATLDVWRLAVSSPTLMACLVIRNKDEVVEKLAKELPFTWELVCLHDWRSALSTYKAQFRENELEDSMLNELINNKIDKIAQIAPVLDVIGKVLKQDVLGTSVPELRALKLLPLGFLRQSLDADFQELRRRNAEYKWPEMLEPKLQEDLQGLPDAICNLVAPHNDFHFSVLYLPFILAWRSVDSSGSRWNPSAADIFKIQQIKQFDETWFDMTFQFLFGWLSQQNLQELH